MKHLFYILLFLATITACDHTRSGMAYDGKDSTTVVSRLLEDSRVMYEEHDMDSALSLMLTAADYAKGCHDPQVNYQLFKANAGM